VESRAEARKANNYLSEKSFVSEWTFGGVDLKGVLVGKSAQTASKPRPLQATYSYLSGSVAELKRVQPPSKQEAIQQTVAVLVLIVLFSAALAMMDGAFQVLMGWLVGGQGRVQ
jgi:preprotein translocase SecE subunit